MSNRSKLCERCTQQQISEYFESLWSKFHTRRLTLPFSDGPKLRKNRDNKGVFAVVLTDLSKGFDSVPHGLPKVKLNVSVSIKNPSRLSLENKTKN